jgi:phosphoglycerol transferase MdoB-like AlkP superfamily enzyme
MKRIIAAFIKYYLFWVVYFTFFKVLFILYNYPVLNNLPTSEIWGIFRHGIVMDFSAAGYLSLFPGVIFGLGYLVTARFSTSFLKYYTLLLLILMTVLGISDSGLYQPWGSRLNAQLFEYLKTPGGIIASLDWWQLVLIPILFTGIIWGSMWLFNRMLPQNNLKTTRMEWYGIPAVLLLAAALILPIRGSLDSSPMNHSSVYFSEYIEANQSAYNYFWNLMHSTFQNNKSKMTVHYMDDTEAETVVRAHDNSALTVPKLILQKEGKPTNIILVLLESFSNKIIEPFGGLPGVTNRLNEFYEEGIAFPNFYSTGNRSDKGMSALIGGFPSDMRRTTALSFPDRMSQLDYLPRYFANMGYNMSFYYGGDVNFYNTRAVMIESGIKKIVSKENFPLKLGRKQNWGVPDEYLYARLFNDLKNEPQPFFNMVYTISSHEPFDIEGYKKFNGSSVEQKYLNVAAYADSCLGNFIDSLKQTDYWENTLVIITSDHTSLQPGPSNITEPSTYNIPLIMIGGVVPEHQVCECFGNQNDLGPMLLNQLGQKHKPDILSKDFLVEGDYAFYFRQEGWGFVSPEMGWFYNINTNMQDFFYNYSPEKTDSVMHFAKAYVQYLHNVPFNKM